MSGPDLLTPAEMAALERGAIDSGAVSGAALMERAGAGCVAALAALRPDLASGPGEALVLCGPGNNGGDGYVIARLLAARGRTVELHEFGDPARLPPDAAVARAAWLAAGGTAAPLEPEALRGRAPSLAVDALFGGGLTRPLPEALAPLRDLAPEFTLAVDLPSGLDGESGRDLGVLLPADLTVTFHRERLGHHLGAGPEVCGALRVVDIGLEPHHRPGAVRRIGAPSRARLGKARAAHKYDHGHALVLAGGPGRGGAARMAARAALRVGAGLVTLGVPPAALQENAARLDAVMLRPIRDAAALAAALEDRRVSAVLIGPGHGIDARTREMAEAALGSGRPVVLDADALTVFAGEAGRLAGAPAVLTPHMGEFRRLFPEAPEDPIGAARAMREALPEAVLVLKGPATLVASAEGLALRSGRPEEAAPWLATAGAGDVLAGLIVGLLARGLPPAEAAETAVWLHAEAGRRLGPGLIAEDLPEALPGLLRSLGA